MFGFLMFIIVFLVTYFVFYAIFDDMLKKEKYARISELVILTKKFNLDKKKMNYRSCLNGVAIINAFILGIGVALVETIKIIIPLRLLIVFIVMILLILGMYYGYGKYLNKKWGKK